MAWFSIHHILVHIHWAGIVYDLSWIEAIGTLTGLLCMWYAGKAHQINYVYGLVNVTLFAIIFFQIQLYASLLLQLFFWGANVYGLYAWRQHQNDTQHTLRIRYLSRRQHVWVGLCAAAATLALTMTIDPVFRWLAHVAVSLAGTVGVDVALPEMMPDAYPFWDAAITVLSMVAMVLMTRKYVEHWWLWCAVNVMSVLVFFWQGVYFMALEYAILLGLAGRGTYLWSQDVVRQARE